MMINPFGADPWLKEGGGPAFPLSIPVEGAAQSYKGMTLRDWFAGQVLSTMIWKSEDGDGGWDVNSVACGSYALADAMLAARNKKSEG